jgi:hypothetical protein
MERGNQGVPFQDYVLFGKRGIETISLAIILAIGTNRYLIFM